MGRRTCGSWDGPELSPECGEEMGRDVEAGAEVKIREKCEGRRRRRVR